MPGRYNFTQGYGNSHPVSNPLRWMTLPSEIRLMILEAITQLKHPGWTLLASVCKEWQLFIEKRNFYKLKLRVSCLDSLGLMTRRPRKLVHHIWLDIELPRYTCRSCNQEESGSWTQLNSSIVGKAIWELFSVLTTWKPANDLTLELSVHSPSDSDHWFKDYYFASDLDGNTDITSAQATERLWNDPIHGWINGQQLQTPPRSAILRLFEWVDPYFRKELPSVDAVTCFIMRRQMIYEPWRPWQSGWRVLRDKHFLHFVENQLPKTIKRVSIFEDFSDNLATAMGATGPHLHWLEQVDAVRVADAKFGAAFAYRSLDLKQLSVSYMVNAEDFFHACSSTWTWQHLESLVLTSQLLRFPGRSRDIDALLYNAGIAALRMPRLNTMVLWNGTKGNACAFIYHKDKSGAGVTWRATWDLELSRRVEEVWQRVALKRTKLALRISKQHLQGGIGSHADAIHRLELPCQVVSPASLWQMRRENT